MLPCDLGVTCWGGEENPLICRMSIDLQALCSTFFLSQASLAFWSCSASNPRLSGDGTGRWDWAEVRLTHPNPWAVGSQAVLLTWWILMDLCSWKSAFLTLTEVCPGAQRFSKRHGGEGWLGSGWLFPWHYTWPGPFQATKFSWNVSFSKRPSLTIVTLGSQTPAACTVCTTSFILPWLIDPRHAQGKRPFANIHVVKCHVISPMKIGCCKIWMQAT